MSTRTYSLVALSLVTVLLVTAGIYWKGLNGPFLLDDNTNIVQAYVGDFDIEKIRYALTHNDSGVLGRPVSMFSLLFSGIVHGPGPRGYKFDNLAIHLLNGVLIFWLLVRLLPRMSTASRENILLASGLVAAIWLLHPLMVSTVLYAVQRMAELSALFTLAALVSYTFIRENISAAPVRFYPLAYVLFPLFFGLAVFSKENGALIPFYLAMFELIVYRFGFATTAERNRLGVFLGIFAVLPVVAGAIYFFTHFQQFADYSTRDFTMGERLMTQLPVLASYLKMILLPRLSDMTLFHDYVEPTRSFDAVTGILLMVLLGAVYLVFYLRKRAPVVSFAIAWFLVSHLMESSVFSLELMFEHRNYLAAVGPLLCVCYYCCCTPGLPQLKYVAGIFMVLVLFLTAGRVTEWQSRALIYQMAITEHPDSTRAQTEMAGLKYSNGDIRGSLINLEAAKEINPQEPGIPIQEAVFLCGTDNDLAPLLEEAWQKAVRYRMSVYALNSLDNLVKAINDGACAELNYEYPMKIVQAALAQEDNRENRKLTGYLENIEGRIHLLEYNYAEGIRNILSAYDKTGSVRILGNLAENLLQLNLVDDAGVVISEIGKINEKSHGIETAMLTDLQDKLAAARARNNPAWDADADGEEKKGE